MLTDWVPAVLEQDEGATAASVADPGEVAVIRATAVELAAGMSGEEMTIIRGRLAGLPDVETARQIRVSRPTLIKRRRVLFDQLREAAQDLSETGQQALIDEISLLVMERTRF